MRKFLTINPGLARRFSLNMEFPDYSPEELFEIKKIMCTKQKVALSTAITNEFASRMFKECDHAQNGGFAASLLKACRSARRKRCGMLLVKKKLQADPKQLDISDMKAGFKVMPKKR